MDLLPPGFRFFPIEEELVSFYLHNKIEAASGAIPELERVIDRIIPVLDIYNYNPWDLRQFSGERSRNDPEQWFFFIPRQESEARGGRPKRLTDNGYWKATGSPGYVFSNNRCIGMKRTMVFYEGRAPRGKKTEWKMNEYKAIHGDFIPSSSNERPILRQEFSLCRVYKKSKSLRAFDRRPIGVEIVDVAQQEGNRGAEIPRTTSRDSSSSGDDPPLPPTFVTGESSSSAANATDVDNDPCWDWEQLDWSYGDMV